MLQIGIFVELTYKRDRLRARAERPLRFNACMGGALERGGMRRTRLRLGDPRVTRRASGRAYKCGSKKKRYYQRNLPLY